MGNHFKYTSTLGYVIIEPKEFGLDKRQWVIVHNLVLSVSKFTQENRNDTGYLTDIIKFNKLNWLNKSWKTEKIKREHRYPLPKKKKERRNRIPIFFLLNITWDFHCRDQILVLKLNLLLEIKSFKKTIWELWSKV